MSDLFDDLFDDPVDANATPDGPTASPPAAGAGPTDEATSHRYITREVRATIQELLKYGLLEADRKNNLYRTAVTHTPRINEALEPLDLTLRVDEIRGIAFLVVVDGFVAESTESTGSEDGPNDEWSHPLVRRQRLTAEQSLLVALLRQLYLAHEQEAGIGAGNAVATVDDVKASLQLYFGTSGSDSRDDKRTRALLENLRNHNLVSEIDDKDQFNIRAIITQLADPDSLSALLTYYKRLGAVDASDIEP